MDFWALFSRFDFKTSHIFKTLFFVHFEHTKTSSFQHLVIRQLFSRMTIVQLSWRLTMWLRIIKFSSIILSSFVETYGHCLDIWTLLGHIATVHSFCVFYHSLVILTMLTFANLSFNLHSISLKSPKNHQHSTFH